MPASGLNSGRIEAWTGNIVFGDSSRVIEGETAGPPSGEGAKYTADVHILNRGDNRQSCLASDSNLQFLSLVDVASIPLYLAVGPSLDVCIHNEATQQWIIDSFISTSGSEVDPEYPGEPWWVRESGQLERGILLKVEDGDADRAKRKQNVTELLLYATVSLKSLNDTNLRIPPPSSPSRGSGTTSTKNVDYKSAVWDLYALPLSSHLLHRTASIRSSLIDDSDEARFLAPFAVEPPDEQISPKRKTITSLFEDATQQRKRLKKRGGEGVSKAMSAYDAYPPTCQNTDQFQITSLVQGISESKLTARATLSRASSAVSSPSLEPSRPPSRRETTKRSSLHRVESISSPRESSCVSDSSSSIEQQNRSALTRIVMAGMRVYGLQQRKRSSKPHGSNEVPLSDLETHLPNVLTEDDSEYKLVYHQTFKAACFTFRTHIATALIPQEALREIVDRLLAIFCTDPRPADNFCGTTNSVTEINRKTENPFDLPSANTYTIDSAKD